MSGVGGSALFEKSLAVWRGQDITDEIRSMRDIVEIIRYALFSAVARRVGLCHLRPGAQGKSNVASAIAMTR